MTKRKISDEFCAYIVQCRYGTYYAGWTNDITKRIKSHNEGTGAKYLRGKGPVKLIYKKIFATSKEAQEHERYIKNLKRNEKEDLVKLK